MSAAQEAAAALAPAMAAELVEAMPLAGEDALAADIAATGAAAAPVPVPSSQPQTAPVAAAPAPAAPAEVEFDLNLDPVIPDDLQELLDEPDFDEEAALEVNAEREDWDEDATDPETAKRLKALEKRNKWLEDRVVATESKKWLAENLKAYPLLARYAADEVAGITATSRRAFARQAATLNTRLATMLKPALEDIAEKQKLIRGEVTQEVRADYRDNGWGTITTGPATVPVEQSAYETQLKEANKSGQLHRVIGVMMRAAGVTNETI